MRKIEELIKERRKREELIMERRKREDRKKEIYR